MKPCVNGRFMAAPRGGVRRFAEIVATAVLREVGGVVLLPAGAPRPDPLPDGVEVRTGRLRGHLWEQIELPAAARRTGCDVVLHLANTAPVAGGPHVVTVHDVTPLTDPRWFGRSYAGWHRRVVRPALRRAAAILTVSRWSAMEIVRTLEVPPERVHTVEQGAAPLDAPSPPDEVCATRRRLGLPERYLLAVGSRDPRKNLAFLGGVLDEMDACGLPPIPLVLVGGRDRRRVWAEPPAFPTGSRIVTVGEVDDRTLGALYTGASALCHPALAEGFGRPPLEALACGAPVVTAPYGSAEEVLGDAAERVPLDPAAWAEALGRVLAEPPAAREVRRDRGRRQAARHRWEDGVRRVLEVCRGVAGAVA